MASTITNPINNIFPGLAQSDKACNIEEKIIDSCDTNSQLQLCQVNKCANRFLSKSPIFEKSFFTQHPPLDSYGKLFTKFCSDSPENCWKVLCRVMDIGCKVPYPVPIDPSCFEKVKSRVLNYRVNSEKPQFEKWKAIQEKWKVICSSDLTSRMDKARKDYETYKKERLNFITQLQGIITSQQYIRSTDVWQQYILSTGATVEDHLGLFSSLNANSQGIFGVDITSQLKNYSQLIQNAILKAKLEKLLRENYKLLELKQNTNIAEAESALKNAFSIENAIKNKPHLEKCLNLLDRLIERPEEKTPAALKQIRDLINACTFEYKNNYTVASVDYDDSVFIDSSLIWRSVCVWDALGADGFIKDSSWAENHFHEFLPYLRTLIRDAISMADNNIKNGQKFLTIPNVEEVTEKHD